MTKWNKLINYTKCTFNFDIRKEKIVYLFLCEKKENKKLTADMKFYNYKSWRLYIIKKFEVYGKDSLIEFDKMLNYLIRDSVIYNRFTQDICIATISVILTLFVSGFMEMSKNTIVETSLMMFASVFIGIIIVAVFFIWILANLYDTYSGSNFDKLFLNDVKQIVEEIIETK